MTIIPEPPKITLVGELVAHAARDLDAFAHRGPNYRAAGQSALINIDACIGLLRRARVHLVRDMNHAETQP